MLWIWCVWGSVLGLGVWGIECGGGGCYVCWCCICLWSWLCCELFLFLFMGGGARVIERGWMGGSVRCVEERGEDINAQARKREGGGGDIQPKT